MQAVALLAITAAGTFGGHLAWRAYDEHRAAKQAADERAAADAARLLPLNRQQRAVKRALSDPDSAVFRNEAVATHDKTIWCGEVNARNRMGGMVGFARYVVVLMDHPELEQFDEVRIEPSDSQSGEAAAFKQRHLALCR